jgi:hypothetical protein
MVASAIRATPEPDQASARAECSRVIASFVPAAGCRLPAFARLLALTTFPSCTRGNAGGEGGHGPLCRARATGATS